MVRTVLVTTGNGMFGRALSESLAGVDGVRVRAMVRDRSKFAVSAPNIEVITGDMGRPETLAPAVKGCTHVFLTAPMDDHVAEREQNVIRAAKEAGGVHILKLFGAVKHDADRLMLQHTMALDSLKASGLPWTLISPNSVMETSLLPCAQVAKFNCLLGMSGRGRVGLVALHDVTSVTRAWPCEFVRTKRCRSTPRPETPS